nr:glycosyl hydrolase family 18 protein [uncultured Lacibacter sp.]
MTQRIVSLTVLLLFPFLFCNAQTANGKAMEVIAYYAAGAERIDQYKVEALTQIIFSFGHLKGNKLHISNKRDTATIQKLVSLKQRNPRLKVLLSLGGWGGCSSCSDVFSSNEGRSEFALSVKEALTFFKADGIDLDWEYPTIKGYPGHTYKKEDKENFTSLVQTLRSTLHKGALISFAAGGFEEYLEQSIDWKAVLPVVDFVNLMTYDLVHGYSTVTGHHTALYSTAQQTRSADWAIRYFEQQQLPLNKLIIGAAFYARSWINVKNENNGLYQNGVFKDFIAYSQFATMLNKDNGFVFYRDIVAQAPYAYNSSTNTYATFDDEESIAEKVKYIKAKKLGGIMFWELSLDKPTNGLLQVIDQTINKK